ncbi:hypothetical protein CRE_07171 [Caenorhabditis remanei]|uniref:C2H2-type domain-containing protein n=1 Tax=Caenorhabditis remanei TaxID=31234 RepID=E3NTE5_CAERE|nr:hypothetical protein CRE_07171 [Caenorhabditis remanei]
MSFSSYCQECDSHFDAPCTRNKHVAVAHNGVMPPNPEISEELFYTMNSHVPQVRSRTCPICLEHFPSLHSCIYHVDIDHSLFHYIWKAEISEWERLVEAVFPGGLNFVRKLYSKRLPYAYFQHRQSRRMDCECCDVPLSDLEEHEENESLFYDLFGYG